MVNLWPKVPVVPLSHYGQTNSCCLLDDVYFAFVVVDSRRSATEASRSK